MSHTRLPRLRGRDSYGGVEVWTPGTAQGVNPQSEWEQNTESPSKVESTRDFEPLFRTVTSNSYVEYRVEQNSNRGAPSRAEPSRGIAKPSRAERLTSSRQS